MSLRDAYRQKMEAQLEEQQAHLEVMKAKVKQAVADGKIMAYEELADAEGKLASTKAKLKELGAASDGAWQELKGGVESAWSDLTEACKKAAGKFGGKT